MRMNRMRARQNPGWPRRPRADSPRETACRMACQPSPGPPPDVPAVAGAAEVAAVDVTGERWAHRGSRPACWRGGSSDDVAVEPGVDGGLLGAPGVRVDRLGLYVGHRGQIG